MNATNGFINQLNIQYPIIQAPMLGITSPEMVAAISNAGGLGSLPVGGLSAEKTRLLIQQTKQLTDKPFAVNLFVHKIPEISTNQAVAMQDFLEKMANESGLPFQKAALQTLVFHSYKDQVSILIDEDIKIVSFTFGIPDTETVSLLKERNILLIGTATCLKEALLLQDAGVSAIVVQGIEAGGHRGSFLDDEALPQIGLMALLPQVADAVNIPVIASGAIKDGRTIKAAFVLGAAAVQVGSVFLACNESLAIPAYKQRLTDVTDADTKLARAFSGRWARGVKNEMIQLVEGSGLAIPPYPVQNSLTTPLRAAAQKSNTAGFTSMWAGQAARGAVQKPIAEIFMDMVNDYKNVSKI